MKTRILFSMLFFTLFFTRTVSASIDEMEASYKAKNFPIALGFSGERVPREERLDYYQKMVELYIDCKDIREYFENKMASIKAEIEYYKGQDLTPPILEIDSNVSLEQILIHVVFFKNSVCKQYRAERVNQAIQNQAPAPAPILSPKLTFLPSYVKESYSSLIDSETCIEALAQKKINIPTDNYREALGLLKKSLSVVINDFRNNQEYQKMSTTEEKKKKQKAPKHS